MSTIFTFVGGINGPWKVVRHDHIVGESLEQIDRLQIVQGSIDLPPVDTVWSLRGVVSNLRYTTQEEKKQLTVKSPDLGRAEDTCAALIVLKKSDAWWQLAQDERRAIIEEQSEHIKKGLMYLPAIARRLHHSRDLGEPFDFITWFEYAPNHSEQFEELVALLRSTLEWEYVEREVDIRLVLDES